MNGAGEGKGADARKEVRGPVALVLIAAIRAYQLSLSFFLGRHWRHGAYAGLWLGLFRVARCHPWGTHGFDPPPEEAPRRELRFWRYARLGRRR